MDFMEAAIQNHREPTQDAQKSVKEWLVQLTQQTLPILPHTGKSLLRRLHNPDIALEDVAKVVVQDPVLILHLLRQANKLNHSDITDITNVYHTVTLLGLSNIQKLSRQIPVLTKDLEDKSYQHYMSAVMRSLYAAELARSWAEKRAYHSPGEIYLAALLYSVPMWCLWRFATHEMNLIEHLVVKERIPKKEAEIVVLGCTTEKICQALAKLWNFPEVVKQAMNPKCFPSYKFIIATARSASDKAFPELPPYDPNGVSTRSPAAQVLLANWLAAETDIDWYSRQTNRCMRVLSAFLKVKEVEARQLTQSVAISVSRQFPIPGIRTPACRLILLPEESIRRRIKLTNLKLATEKISQNWEKIESGELKNIAEIEEKEQSGELSISKPAQTATSYVAASPPQSPSTRISDQSRAVSKPAPRKAVALSPHLLASDLKLEMIRDFIQELRESSEVTNNIPDLLTRCCEVIHEGIGLERVVAAMTNKRATKLRGFTSAGLANDIKLAQFEVDLQENTLFKRLLVKPAGIWVDPKNQVKALSLVPFQFIDDCQTDRFFLQSIFSGGQALGVIYADRGINGGIAELLPRQYKSFKLVCSTVTEHLNRDF